MSAPDYRDRIASALNGRVKPLSDPTATALFAGEGAANADRAALATAKQMHGGGASRDSIYDRTKWWPGDDGKWRFEIPDDAAELAPRAQSVFSPSAGNGPDLGTARPPPGQKFHPGVGLGEFMRHDELQRAYPDAYRMPRKPNGTNLRMHYWKDDSDPHGSAFTKPALSQVPKGERDPDTYGPDQYMEINAPDSESARSIGLHELQHYIQNREGFTTGADPSVVGSEAYLDNPGEREARIVQQRARMTPEQRKAVRPWMAPPMEHPRHEGNGNGR